MRIQLRKKPKELRGSRILPDAKLLVGIGPMETALIAAETELGMERGSHHYTTWSFDSGRKLINEFKRHG